MFIELLIRDIPINFDCILSLKIVIYNKHGVIYLKISVIISTYNSSELLIKALCGYEAQTDKDFEIIVADDGSDVAHRERYEKYASELKIPVSYVWHPDEGFRKNRILNQAIIASQGEYLLFTDGDCIPEPDFLVCHRNNAEKGRFLSGGACRLRADVSAKIGFSEINLGLPFKVLKMMQMGRLHSTFFIKMGAKNIGINAILDKLVPVKMTFNGGNSSCWKKDAIAIGGFDERMGYGGEDCEFGFRLKNYGIQPKRIRYSARCVHLEHSREYYNKDIHQSNSQIIKRTIHSKHTVTKYGLNNSAPTQTTEA
ncbi:MAG: glycosyltransferase [Hyphomicrobiales bacterium]